MDRPNKKKGPNPLNKREASPAPPAGPEAEELLAKGERMQIDGSLMEGGGQILRNCTSLAGILGKSIQISKIRAGRDKPGLKAQHMTGIQLVRNLYNGILTGDKINSMEIKFTPGKFQARDLVADTGTAGSISLLIQVALPCALFGSGPIKLSLGGGTNAAAAPQIDYLIQVFQPIAARMGIKFDIDVKMRGFYPRGLGQVELSVSPVQHVLPITMVDPGTVLRVRGRAFVAGQIRKEVADRMVAEAKRICKKHLPESVEYAFETVQETHKTAFGDGAGIILVAETSTGCLISGPGLGERGKPAEKVGEEAANMLVEGVLDGGCVDEYLQDQLIIFMALAPGVSRLRTGPLSLHTQTSIHFSSLLTGAKFSVTEIKEKRNPREKATLIECQGIGFQNQYLSAPVGSSPSAPSPAAVVSASPAPAAAPAPPAPENTGLGALQAAYSGDNA